MTLLDHHDGSARSTGTEFRPLLVNVTQAAEILAVSRTSLYQLIWSGELTPIHIGRSVRFAVEQLEAFVNERLASGSPQ